MNHFDGLQELNEMEIEKIDRIVEENAFDMTENQKRLVRMRINPAREQKARRKRRIPKRLLLPFAALLVLVSALFASAASHSDWDIRMQEIMGFGNVRQYLPGGFIQMNEKAVSSGHTLHVYQSIGDQNSQWIWIRSDIPWELTGDDYYMFEECDFAAYHGDRICSGGGSLSCFNDNGYLGIMVSLGNIENINRARIEICLENLNAYSMGENGDETKNGILPGKWNLEWENRYAANIKTYHPMKIVHTEMSDGTQTSILITKVELSAVSLHVRGRRNPFARGKSNPYADISLPIEGITLEDGTEILIDDIMGGYGSNGVVESYTSFCGEDRTLAIGEDADIITINPDEVVSIKVAGETIHLK